MTAEINLHVSSDKSVMYHGMIMGNQMLFLFLFYTHKNLYNTLLVGATQSLHHYIP